MSYTTSYQYNTANQMTQLVYPVSLRALNITHDNQGRVASIADQYRTYLNNITRNGAGQVTGLSLGSAASESYDYDANRMQLTTQTATQTGGATGGLMNVTYGYQASAGQMGSGSTAGNAGQLISISGTIGGVTETAAYSYDNLGRLVTSNQTSNGSSAQRRFAYDRWGNRTGMWDAVSGGNQIQSITLQQSGGAPTNRITSVTSGSTVNYTYDAAGNVTNDGAHVYTYDAENRLKTVDWGTGNQAAYAYDYANRRIKTSTSGGVTYYVWEGSQVIGEYNSTGGVNYNYVYSGSRQLSKIGFGVVNWFVSDRLSTRLMLDGSGNVIGRQGHLPFGEDFGESGTQEKHHFTSYERDSESSTDYAINRGSSSAVGRFLQADPYKANGYVIDPQSWNRYGYSGNDPVSNVDPLGLDWVSIGYAILGGIVKLSVTESLPSSPSPGSHPPPGQLLDGGELGLGGGVGQVLRNLSPKDSAKEFLKKWPACEQAINDAAATKGKGTFDQALNRVNFIDAGDLADSELAQSLRKLGFPETGDENEMQSSLDSHVGLFGKDVALTNPANHKIYLSSRWSSDHSVNFGGKVDSVTAHEVLHDLFQGDHKKIAEALGIDTSGSDTDVSKRIDAWLDKGCKK